MRIQNNFFHGFFSNFFKKPIPKHTPSHRPLPKTKYQLKARLQIWLAERQIGDTRAITLWCVLLCLGASVMGRHAWLLMVRGDYLEHQAIKRQIITKALPAVRGALLDRHGRLLAQDSPMFKLTIGVQETLKYPSIIQNLAPILEVSEEDLVGHIRAHRGKKQMYFDWKVLISPNQAYQVRNIVLPVPSDKPRQKPRKAPGLRLNELYKRFYPMGEIAAPFLGFTKENGEAQAGLEFAWNKILEGHAGKQTMLKNGKGDIVEDLNRYVPARPGQDVFLTIDSHIQYLTYNAIKYTVEHYNAKNGMAAVMDSQTGEILSMVNYPSANPNAPDFRQAFQQLGLHNGVALDQFEPGSTMKGLVVAWGLQKHVIFSGSTFDIPGAKTVINGMTIPDHHHFDALDLAGILRYSSNAGSALIGHKLGKQQLHQGFVRFGIGQDLGLNLPGSTKGTLRDYKKWMPIDAISICYGYSVGVTGLHLMRAYGAIANHGALPSLSLLKHIGDAQGENISPWQQNQVSEGIKPPTQILHPDVAKLTRRLLEEVVSPTGTAPLAAVPGYRVAGKTGTSRKLVNGRYSNKNHASLFVGMAPAGAPRLVAMIYIDEPKEDYYGGKVAGPAFSQIMREALLYLKVSPDTQPPMTLPVYVAPTAAVSP